MSNERVEEIRRQYDAHFVNGAHEDCGWRFGCATVRDLLTALAQAQRERDQAKADYADASGECDEMERDLARVRAAAEDHIQWLRFQHESYERVETVVALRAALEGRNNT